MRILISPATDEDRNIKFDRTNRAAVRQGTKVRSPLGRSALIRLVLINPRLHNKVDVKVQRMKCPRPQGASLEPVSRRNTGWNFHLRPHRMDVFKWVAGTETQNRDRPINTKHPPATSVCPGRKRSVQAWAGNTMRERIDAYRETFWNETVRCPRWKSII